MGLLERTRYAKNERKRNSMKTSSTGRPRPKDMSRKRIFYSSR